MYHFKNSNKKGIKGLSIYIMLTFMSPKFNLDLVLLTMAISLKCRMVAFLEGEGGGCQKRFDNHCTSFCNIEFYFEKPLSKDSHWLVWRLYQKSEKQIRFYFYLLLKTCIFNTKLFCGSNCCRGESNSLCRHCGGYCSWCCWTVLCNTVRRI